MKRKRLVLSRCWALPKGAKPIYSQRHTRGSSARKCEAIVEKTPIPNPHIEQEPVWTTIIRPTHPWFAFHFRELWQYRDLISLFVRRDFVARYKQTILGPIWFFIAPLCTTVVFTIVFGKIAKIPTDGVPPFLFYLAGTVCWQYFSECLTMTSNTFVANAGIFGKVYFPRLTAPVSVVISSLIKFVIQFVLFLGFFGFYWTKGADIHPTKALVMLPLLLAQMAILGLGFGVLISSLTTKYRDLTVIVGFGVQLWMYATPVVYPLSQIPERYRAVFALNPMTSVVESFRAGFFGNGCLKPEYYLLGIVVTCVVFFLGVILFSRVEKTFMDTV